MFINADDNQNLIIKNKSIVDNNSIDFEKKKVIKSAKKEKKEHQRASIKTGKKNYDEFVRTSPIVKTTTSTTSTTKVKKNPKKQLRKRKLLM